MSIPVLDIGSSFYRVKCIGIECRYMEIFDEDGVSQNVTRTFYIMQCDCGSEPFDIMKFNWKGQKHNPDCGCGLADMSEGRVSLIVQVTPALAMKVKLESRKRGLKASQFIRSCMIAGVEGRIKECQKS